MSKNLKTLALLTVLMVCMCASVALAGDMDEVSELQAVFTNGGTAVLDGDIDVGEGTLTVAEGKTVTLDLNGYSIVGKKTTTATKNHEMILISTGASMTIRDSKGGGKITYEYTGATTNYSYYVNTISNASGTLVVESGTIENLTNVSSQISYVIDTLTNGTRGDATTTIKGGVINSPYYIAMRTFANSTTHTAKIVITGGTFTGRIQIHDSNAKANKSELIISGGTFNASTAASQSVYIYGHTDTSNLKVSVSDGVFNGTVQSVTAGGGELVTGYISGGSYKYEPDEDLIKPGEKAVLIDGRYYLGDTVPPQPKLPKTGDNAHPALLAMLLLSSVCALALLRRRARA